MAFAYWVSQRIQIHDPESFKAYAAKAGPAITAAGGTFLTRGGRVKSLEGWEQARITVIRFDSMDAALACYHGDAYQDAHSHIPESAVERDLSLVEGLENPEPRGDTAGPVVLWIGGHMTIHDPDKMAAYVEKAGPAMVAAGGRYLVRGGRVESLEGFQQPRVALAELPNWQVAEGFYDSPGYSAARAALDGGCTRDICIAECLADV